jgi:hypothetical protein
MMETMRDASAIFDAFDVGAEQEELFVDVFVAAVDVIEAADFGGALGC